MSPVLMHYVVTRQYLSVFKVSSLTHSDVFLSFEPSPGLTSDNCNEFRSSLSDLYQLYLVVELM